MDIFPELGDINVTYAYSNENFKVTFCMLVASVKVLWDIQVIAVAPFTNMVKH